MATSRTPVTQAVVLLVDGIRADVLEALLGSGDLPAIARLFPDTAVSRLCSVFPSTTGPAHLPFLTGRYPGACNVPGIRWLDPERYAASTFSLSRFRSYIGPGALLVGRDLAPGVRTLFDLIPDHANAGGNVRRGLRRSRNLTRWGKLREPVLSFFTEQWSRLDDQVGRAVAAAVAEGTRFVFAVFSAADSLGHKFGPDSDEARAAYRRIDAALGALADHVDRMAGGERPLMLLVSDHGLSATHTHFDLHAAVERVAGRCLAHPTVWRGFFDARAAVMVSGNAMAHVYIREAGWARRPLLDAPSAITSALLDTLLGAPAIDQVIGRAVEGGAVVISRDGKARIRRVGHRIEYAVTAGADPFGYPKSAAGLHDEREWLELTWDSCFPDAPVQVLQLLQSPRTGDLIVNAAPGHDLRARFEKPVHAGSHGSLHREHMMTPLLSNRPLAPGAARTVDICPTVLQALAAPEPPGLDGRSLWKTACGEQV